MSNDVTKISDEDYFSRMDYWDVWAYDNGGLQVCSYDGNVLYTIGVKHG